MIGWATTYLTHWKRDVVTLGHIPDMSQLEALYVIRFRVIRPLSCLLLDVACVPKIALLSRLRKGFFAVQAYDAVCPLSGR